MDSGALPSRPQALIVGAFVFLTAAACVGLLVAAAVVPAPPVVMPLVVVTCIACPTVAAWELRPSVDALRARSRARQLAELRRDLARLPETPHPLDR